ncbi:terminase [Sulfitobacter sp. JL08]|uniref:phage terminase large subunit n=1 Tax=Sulfitobacter sp. JL08 TaxID=2070369 RepID=UPI000E0B35DB|nr:phage terminase large subunit [Sulfitobacter sp. JL08]AXI54907.1 terminase [Sulfitobacter sp. JL08]
MKFAASALGRFASVDPDSAYQHNWHIDAIAHQLERIERGEITRLIITMPPRSLKSIAASVAFPAWLLGRNPRKRVLAVSYAEGLSEKLAMDCLKVLDAPWYKECFPATRIERGRAARNDFETSKGGGRFSTSVGGSVTGRGGDIILIDDPHKPEDMTSEVKRNAVLDWYRSTLLSRLNDPGNDPIVLIQQRVHEADLAGVLLEQGGWEHLDLQAIAEEPVEIALNRGRIVRRNEGDLLHAARLPRDLLDRRRDELGSYVFAAQYQQRPAPLSGGLVKWDWFQSYDKAPDRLPGDQIVQSWDTASKAEEANDYSVCTTWLVRDSYAWLIDLHRAKLEFPELRRRVEVEANRVKVSLILIEEAGSGIQMIQDLKQNTRLNVNGIIPKNDKPTRLQSVSPMIEGGRISIPKDAPWLAVFRHELMLFPNGKYDDQVDSLSQFLIWMGRPKPSSGMVRFPL